MKTKSDKSASDYAYKAIKEMMAQYILVPGQKIAYDQLAEKLNLSKTPIINALNRLERENFVTAIQNRGFFIKDISLKEYDELYRIREALELLAIEESINYGSQENLRKAEEAMIAHKNFNDESLSRKRYSLDAIFHLKIAEMSGNSNLIRLLKHVLEQIYLRQKIERVSPNRLQKTPKEHQEIFEAIKEKNVEKAKKKMSIHIENAKKAALEAIQKNADSYEF